MPWLLFLGKPPTRRFRSLHRTVFHTVAFWCRARVVHRCTSREGWPTIVPFKPKHDLWDWHMFQSVGVVPGVNVGIYGSPMECLGKDVVQTPGTV